MSVWKIVVETCWLDLCIDTLLNVFLAIAVDNLANAQELSEAEANAAEEEARVGLPVELTILFRSCISYLMLTTLYRHCMHIV